MRATMRHALPALLVLAACGGDDGATTPEEDHEHGGTAITVWTDRSELFFEHPPIVAGAPGAPWAIHLTTLEDWKPVTAGTLTLRFTSPDGREHVVTDSAPARPGIYTTAPSLPAAGTYDLVMEFRGPRLVDTIPAGRIPVFESATAIPHEEEEEAGGGIAFLKEQQWPIPFASRPAEERAVRHAIEAPAEIVPAAGRMARLAAPAAGLVLTERNRDAPAAGARVRRGQVLAVLSPVGTDDSYVQLLARAERLERELAREERLLALQAIPAKRVEETRHDLEVARETIAAMGGAAGDGYGLVVRAPFAGVVAERRLVPGERVAAGTHLFTVVDPDPVWLRVQVPAMETGRLAEAREATFTVEGGDRVHRAARRVSVSDVIDPARRTVAVVFAVANPERTLRVGALARARLLLADAVTGLAIPAAAVREEDGVPVAYVQTGGESFERRTLALGPSDGEWTIVRSGVSEGERVVTVGAYQVRLASLATGEIAGHGHPH